MKQKRLTTQERKAIWRTYEAAGKAGIEFSIVQIARQYQVSRPTIYSVLEKAQRNQLSGPTWLSPLERKEIIRRYIDAICNNARFVVAKIAREYDVSRHTIYNILHTVQGEGSACFTDDCTLFSDTSIG